MKRIMGIIMSLLLAAAVFLLTPSLSLTANAAEKTADEQQLEALTAYLNALIAQGASEEDIAFANQCIALVKAKVDAAKAAGVETVAAPVMANPGAAAGLIIVGDSRTVQMESTVTNNFGQTGITFIAQNSKGYNWFVENAIPRIDAITGKGTKIVINLGVNDPGNIDKYLAMVNAKAAEWTAKGAKVYYATVNPVWENPYVSEEAVVNFNNRIKTGLVGVNIIDTHDFLVTNGYKLRDGLHYDSATTLSIFNYIIGNLK